MGNRVHPRSRGAADNDLTEDLANKGPSPLTRGSRPRPHRLELIPGSIPAHAGQPRRCQSTGPWPWVHPRSRGAAIEDEIRASLEQGPSPLTRGSLVDLFQVDLDAGSIPAHAGQPARAWPSRRRSRVHPRSRGAAISFAAMQADREGPSPLTRGSPDCRVRRSPRAGSIPAHAGQPRSRRWRPGEPWVHPRSRGAAARRPIMDVFIWGPSPLTRGSLVHQPRQEAGEGSIPAHAGQP